MLGMIGITIYCIFNDINFDVIFTDFYPVEFFFYLGMQTAVIYFSFQQLLSKIKHWFLVKKLTKMFCES